MTPTTTSPDRIDWQAERDRIDLAAVATRLLGPAPGRRGGRGLWWRCPFHEDRNPSFKVDRDREGRQRWKCFGCGEHGDAPALAMKLEGMTFPEAVRFLTGGPAPSGSRSRQPPKPRPTPEVKPERRSEGMPEADAVALVAASAARLWNPEGAAALSNLSGPGTGPRDDPDRPARVGASGPGPHEGRAELLGNRYRDSLASWGPAGTGQGPAARGTEAEVCRSLPKPRPAPDALPEPRGRPTRPPGNSDGRGIRRLATRPGPRGAGRRGDAGLRLGTPHERGSHRFGRGPPLVHRHRCRRGRGQGRRRLGRLPSSASGPPPGGEGLDRGRDRPTGNQRDGPGPGPVVAGHPGRCRQPVPLHLG